MIRLREVAELKAYVETVMARVEHHARGVGATFLTLNGAVIWKADPDSISVREYGAKYGNVAEFAVGGRCHTFRFDHATGSIEMRAGKLNGAVLRRFSDRTPATDIYDYFETL